MQTFDTTIIGSDGGGCFVRVPPHVVEALGGKGRTPVRATFDGVDYSGSVVSMGGERVLGILKEIRARLGKQPGDTVTVTVEVDTGERTVQLSDDLRAAIEQAGVGDAFMALSYSHQREYVTWIAQAKKPDTRARRMSRTIDQLRT